MGTEIPGTGEPEGVPGAPAKPDAPLDGAPDGAIAGAAADGAIAGAAADGAAIVARATAAGRSRLAADATLIEALVRIDEIAVAARAIQEQRADLVEYAIDLTEAVADAVRARDGEADESDAAPEPAGE